MSVDLHGVEPSVPEDGLGHPQVAGGLHQVTGHGVAEGVGGDARRELGGLTVALDQVLKGANREGLALTVNQQRSLRSDGETAGLIEPEQLGDRLTSAGVERDEPGIATLAEVAGKIKHFARDRPLNDVTDGEAANLRDPKPGVEQQDQHGAVTEPKGATRGDGAQKGPDFRRSENTHKTSREESGQATRPLRAGVLADELLQSRGWRQCQGDRERSERRTK